MHLFVAHLIAERQPRALIAKATGYKERYIGTLAQEPLLKLRVNQIRDEMTSRRIERATDLGAFFDEAAVGAAKRLEELSIEADTDAVKRGAINDILAYSPNAPKMVKFQPDAGDQRLIQLGVAVVEGMKEALTESGRKDVVDLFEGEDYHVMDEALAVEAGRVVVREV